MKTPCPWALKSELDKDYHDNEWGKVLKDEDKFFEVICLECFQAGLSWSCVLKKREAMRKAFDGFCAETIATYDEKKIASFMQNKELIKNQAKLKAMVENAKVYLEIKAKFGGFYEYLWGHLLLEFNANFKRIINHYKDIQEIPPFTPLSEFIAKKLKKQGFKFLGKTSTYALLQSVGVVDDHLDSCPAKGKS